MRLLLVRFLMFTSICGTYSTVWPYTDGTVLAAETDAKVPPASIGPFEIMGAGGSRIRFQFAGQLRTELECRDYGLNGCGSDRLFMQARRLRPTMTVYLPELNLSFRLHLSTAPKSVEMMDLYFNYEAFRHLQFRCGQYKVPFTRYRMQSFQQLTFVDWAIVTQSFGAERQMGLAVHNGYENPPEWGYAVGVFTGVNARSSHAVKLAKIYGEENVNISDLSGLGITAEFHPELFLHLCYNAKGIQIRSDTDEKRDGFCYSAGLSAAWDLDPTIYKDFVIRLSPELLIKYMGISFFTAGYAGIVETEPDGRVDLAMVGGLFQAAYRFNRRFEVSARYALVDFEDVVVNDAYDRAQMLIAAAKSVLDSASVKDLAQDNYDSVSARYKDAGQILREQEFTIGFNTYMIGHYLKWQNDCGLLQHTRREGTRFDYVARSQIQLAF